MSTKATLTPTPPFLPLSLVFRCTGVSALQLFVSFVWTEFEFGERWHG